MHHLTVPFKARTITAALTNPKKKPQPPWNFYPQLVWPWLMPGPQTGSWNWSKENVTQQKVCELWLCRRSDDSVLPFMRKNHPNWLIHIHQFLLSFLMGFVEFLYLIFIATGSDVALCTSFMRSFLPILPKEWEQTLLFIHPKQRGENRCLELTLKQSPC